MEIISREYTLSRVAELSKMAIQDNKYILCATPACADRFRNDAEYLGWNPSVISVADLSDDIDYDVIVEDVEYVCATALWRLGATADIGFRTIHTTTQQEDSHNDQT